MSEGRHEHAVRGRHGRTDPSAGLRRWRRVAIGLATLLVVGGAGGGAYWLTRQSDDPPASAASTDPVDASACRAPVTVSVAVVEGYAAPLQELAASIEAGEAGSSLPCTSLEVTETAVGPDGVAEIAPGVAAVFGGAAQMPALAAGAETSGAALDEPGTVASTLAVLAMPRPMAEAAGWLDGPVAWDDVAETVLDPDGWAARGRPELGALTVSLADPGVAEASRVGLAGLAAGAVGTSPADLTESDVQGQSVQGALLALDRQVTRAATSQATLVEALEAADGADELSATTSVALLDERAVLAFNRQSPATPLVAVYPQGGAAPIEISYATVVGPDISQAQHVAAQALGEYLLGSAGQELLARDGLRGVDGAPPADLTADSGVSAEAEVAAASPPADVLAALAGGWQHLQNPGRFLVLIDVSGSMADAVAGTGRTKLQFAQDAAIQGMSLVPDAAEIGLWEFATELDGDTDHRELVPVGEVSDQLGSQTRLETLTGAVRGLTPRADTALYDTGLAAFRAMRETYQAGEPNVIILITDGRNDDPGSISLDSLLEKIEDEQDPDAPVRLLTLAYGADADSASLAAMAEATGGTAYTSPNPADIGAVFFEALNAG